MSDHIENRVGADLRDELTQELMYFNPVWTYSRAEYVLDGLLDVLHARQQDWIDAAATWQYNNADNSFLLRSREPMVEALRGAGPST